MTPEKNALLLKLFSEKKLTLREMAAAINVTYAQLRLMRTKAGLNERYVKEGTVRDDFTPEEIRIRTAAVKRVSLNRKKKYGAQHFRPSHKPGYKFCGKTFTAKTFET